MTKRRGPTQVVVACSGPTEKTTALSVPSEDISSKNEESRFEPNAAQQIGKPGVRVKAVEHRLHFDES